MRICEQINALPLAGVKCRAEEATPASSLNFWLSVANQKRIPQVSRTIHCSALNSLTHHRSSPGFYR